MDLNPISLKAKLLALLVAVAIVAGISWRITSWIEQGRAAHAQLECAAADRQSLVDTLAKERGAAKLKADADAETIEKMRKQQVFANQLLQEGIAESAKLNASLATARTQIAKLTAENPNAKALLDTRFDPALVDRVRKSTDEARNATRSGGDRP